MHVKRHAVCLMDEGMATLKSLCRLDHQLVSWPKVQWSRESLICMTKTSDVNGKSQPTSTVGPLVIGDGAFQRDC